MFEERNPKPFNFHVPVLFLDKSVSVTVWQTMGPTCLWYLCMCVRVRMSGRNTRGQCWESSSVTPLPQSLPTLFLKQDLALKLELNDSAKARTALSLPPQLWDQHSFSWSPAFIRSWWSTQLHARTGSTSLTESSPSSLPIYLTVRRPPHCN